MDTQTRLIDGVLMTKMEGEFQYMLPSTMTGRNLKAFKKRNSQAIEELDTGVQVFEYNDGGRVEAGYKGKTGDCVTRSIAIATGKPYKDVYSALHQGAKDLIGGRSKAAKDAAKNASPRSGVHKRVYHKYLIEQGFTWFPTMQIGVGCEIHLHKDELPGGTLIVSLSRHITCVVDGVIQDIYNPQRGGSVGQKNGVPFSQKETRCVYGFYQQV